MFQPSVVSCKTVEGHVAHGARVDGGGAMEEGAEAVEGSDLVAPAEAGLGDEMAGMADPCGGELVGGGGPLARSEAI